MPECHHCPHNGTASPACLDCKGPPETNHKGKTWVSLDSGEGPQTAAMVEAVMEPIQTAGECGGVAMESCCADAARRLLAYLVGLSPTDLSLVLARVRGLPMAAWGRRYGVTKQGAQQRWRAIVRRHPEMEGMFP